MSNNYTHVEAKVSARLKANLEPFGGHQWQVALIEWAGKPPRFTTLEGAVKFWNEGVVDPTVGLDIQPFIQIGERLELNPEWAYGFELSVKAVAKEDPTQ